jgi:predicted GIY-YIG superfamily endonuclease
MLTVGDNQYVGYTNDIKRRLRQHRWEAVHPRADHRTIYQAIKDNGGIDKVQILDVVVDKDKAKELEDKYVKELGKKLNTYKIE